MQIQEPIIIDVDIKKPSYINQPQVTQNDNNTFIVNILDNGQPLDLTGVTTVTIAHTRLDKKTITTGGTVVAGTNQVKFIVDRPETSLVGRVDAVVQLHTADSRISSLAFTYKVNADPTNNYTPTDSEKTLIEVVLNDGPLRIQEAIDAAEYAKEQGDYVAAKKESIDLFTGQQTNLQAQIDSLVVSGDSSPEAAQARISTDELGNSTSFVNLKQRLDTERNALASQLAHTANVTKDRLNIGVTQKTNRKPIISFVDDDGRIDVYTKLKPLVDELRFKLTSCVITGRIGVDSNYMSEAQVKELHDSGLFEIACHTHSHQYSTQMSDTARYNDYRTSKEWLRQRGYADDIIVYPYGDVNESVRTTAQKLFRCGINIDNSLHKVNYPPFVTFSLERVYVDYGFEIAKQKIDEAIANNGWVIFGMHAFYPEFDINVLRQIVEYARLKGIEIVSITEGMNQMGNIVEIGDSYNLEKPTSYIVDCDGNSHGFGSPQTLYKYGYNVNSVPSDFTINKTTITPISNSTGFPTTSGGILITHVYSRVSDFPWTYQEWKPIASNNKYIRYWDRSKTAWSSWQDDSIKIIYLGNNALANTTSYTDASVPKGVISYSQIGSSGTTGFPVEWGGMLMTNALYSSNGYQEFRPNVQNNIYTREWVNGAWTEWLAIGNASHTTAQRPSKPYVGFSYFDRTLGKPLWCKVAAVVDGNGTVTTPAVWVDSVGATVS